MTTEEALEHLRKRKRLMDDRYVDAYPKWTVTDHVALQMALSEIVQYQSAECPHCMEPIADCQAKGERGSHL
jgi:hypothetical protein